MGLGDGYEVFEFVGWCRGVSVVLGSMDKANSLGRMSWLVGGTGSACCIFSVSAMMADVMAPRMWFECLLCEGTAVGWRTVGVFIHDMSAVLLSF